MPLDMNPEIRAQWCAALRSGEYKQAMGQLRRPDEDGEPGGAARYCCLGVLTDLAIKTDDPTVLLDWDDDYENGLSVEGELPDEVREWAALVDHDPTLNPGKPGVAWHTAAWHNDAGATFAEIADLIDGGAA